VCVDVRAVFPEEQDERNERNGTVARLCTAATELKTPETSPGIQEAATH